MRIPKYLIAASLSLIVTSVRGGQWLESYFPLNDGDQKTFVYEGDLTMTMSVSLNFDGTYDVYEQYEGGTASLDVEETNNDCYFTGVPGGWINIGFDPAVLLLDDNILENGGTVKTSTIVHQTGISYPATFTVRVAKAGTITIPGGTFTDCRSITSSEVATVRGQTIEASSLTAYLAPGVGIIKTLLSGGHWAELVSGTVGGTGVGTAGEVPLTVQINGTGEAALKGVGGKLTSSDNTVLLQINQDYIAIATPEKGSVFESWTDANGDILSLSPDLSFTMESNLVLQANFESNPFEAVAGKYIGLFMPYESNTVQNSGFVSVSVTAKGAFSGYLQAGITRHTLAGQFDAYGNATNTLTIKGEGTLTIGLNLYLPGGTGSMGGTVSDGSWTAPLNANQLVSGTVRFSGAGRYTVSFTDSYGNSDGNAVMKFTSSGPTTLAGTLPDGTKFNASTIFSPLSGDNDQWPFYAPLYGGKGCFIGWLAGPDGTGPGSVVGNFIWIKADGEVFQIAASGQPES